MLNRLPAIILLTISCGFVFVNSDVLEGNLPDQKQDIKVHAFDFVYADSSFSAGVYLHLEEDSMPDHYSALISMPVCDDGLCQKLEIELFWDLIGDYIRFDTVAGIPLTKYDHLPFTSQDYEKLHQILSDENSILSRKTVDELFDEEKTRKSDSIDAVTGATAEEVKNAIVEGALYSSYELWHFAQGRIKLRIKEHTDEIYSELLRDKFLKSDSYEMQLYALRRFDEKDFAEEINRIKFILKSDSPLVQLYILKKIPIEVLSEHQAEFVAIFTGISEGGRQLLIDRLTEVQALEVASILKLLDLEDELATAELRSLLAYLRSNPVLVSHAISERLAHLHETQPGKAYYIDQYLSSE
jgi:hypothetical protein